MLNQSLTTKIYFSPSKDPWYNLALEEYLLDSVKKNEIYLYLWQNQNTVVIGRNQNPWKECRCEVLENSGGKLARRLSGGGAVYHDLGNLNFTFIMDKDLYDLSKQLKVIIDSVKIFGIDAEFSGRNDITVNGKKFSGNAYYFRGNAAYHHGTILVDTDFDKLTSYLQVSKEKIISKGIDSVQSRVVNLKNINPNITIEKMSDLLKKTFLGNYGGDGEEIEINNTEKIELLYNKYSSWEWRYGQTPSFDIVLSNKFDWGSIELGLQLKDGFIRSSKIYSDSLEVDFMETISSELIGLPLNLEKIAQKLNSFNDIDNNKDIIIKDLCYWLKHKSI
ncbi:lipoate--protein ligase [Anaerobranca gottschalkii]|uniref:lipoate--protein ligase n=1 Tax=Anaerobranca gottschalkii DSM 13577 TaxID=1120990 RepID=A0A1I0CCM6_9FIRM|nr:lipoate--protein ligase [Anaerobranca gottschalkii]SET17312.1 lipoate-protein ligase [Anaerobranca gottschalkii DSM 13577]